MAPIRLGPWGESDTSPWRDAARMIVETGRVEADAIAQQAQRRREALLATGQMISGVKQRKRAEARQAQMDAERQEDMAFQRANVEADNRRAEASLLLQLDARDAAEAEGLRGQEPTPQIVAQLEQIEARRAARQPVIQAKVTATAKARGAPT